MSEKIKTAVMEIIKAHMVGEDKNTKAVLSDILESVNELETLEQEPCDDATPKDIFCIGCDYKEQEHCTHWKNGKCNGNIEPCDDAISREAVLKPYKGLNDEDTISVWLIRKNIEQQPPVTQKSETVTEFADRCRECGAKYGKLLEQKSGKWIALVTRPMTNEEREYYSEQLDYCDGDEDKK